MTADQLSVPFEKLDPWYFEEVLPHLHPMLRDWAVDRRILRKEEIEPIETLEGLYDPTYFLLPWLLTDIFPVPEDTLLAIGKAGILMMIAFVVVDDTVDGQVPPENRATILITENLNLLTHQTFAEVFPHGSDFWSHFYRYRREMYNGFAAEHYFVDLRSEVYDFDTMRRVLHDKAGYLRVLACAMSMASHRKDLLPVCEDILVHIAFGDQLKDDTRDFMQDYRLGRATYPVQLGIQAVGKQSLTDITPKDLEQATIEGGVFARCLFEVRSVFEEGRRLASGLEMPASHLIRMFDVRLGEVEDLLLKDFLRASLEQLKL